MSYLLHYSTQNELLLNNLLSFYKNPEYIDTMLIKYRNEYLID
jgi:hypothetical protein